MNHLFDETEADECINLFGLTLYIIRLVVMMIIWKYMIELMTYLKTSLNKI